MSDRGGLQVQSLSIRKTVFHVDLGGIHNWLACYNVGSPWQMR